MVQLAHNLVEETETQHRKITGKFHYNAKEQAGKTHAGCEEASWMLEVMQPEWEEKDMCMCVKTEQKCVPFGGVQSKCAG